MFLFRNLFKTYRDPAFLSFEMEALPFDCAELPVASLIWGQTPQSEYEFHRICDHGVSPVEVMGYEEHFGRKTVWPAVATNQCQSLMTIPLKKAQHCSRYGAIVTMELAWNFSRPRCPDARMVPLCS